MANVLSLGMQLTASASGMAKGLSDADRQLQSLARQADAAGKLFDGFTGATAAAAAAQAGVATEFKLLADTLKAGLIDAEDFKKGLAEITASAQQQAAAFAEGARITEQVTTAEEKRAATLARLDALLEQGAINQQTYDRAAADASGANAEAARAEASRAQALSRAASIIQANLTPQQRYDQEVLELTQHLQAGRINQDTFNAAVAKATQAFVRAESAARGYDQVIQNGSQGGTLQFNELSGILAALPGPIGNVAGRLSGLSSAGEGLGRIFSGGLSSGLQGVGASVAGLINPFTVGIAAVAAFGAGASAVARGLVELEDRVEKLGNLADKLGVSFEFIQVLEEAGNRSGVSIESVSSALGRLQKVLAGADEESKAATEALSALGISFTQLEGLSPEEQIRLIGKELQGIEDPAKRTAAAMQIFGKSGAELLPFFNNLGPAADDIERLGGALSEIDRGRIDDFGAGLDALGVASSRLGELLVLPFVGLGEGIAQGSAEFIGGINAIVGPIGDVLEPALNLIGGAFEILGTTLGTIGRVIGATLEPLGTIFQSIGGTIDGFVDSVTGVISGFGDAAVSATEWLTSFTPLGAIADNIGVIGETVSRVANIIGTAFSQVTTYIGEQLASWSEFFGLQSAIESIGGIITTVFGSVSSVFGTIAQAIGGTVGRLLTIAEEFLGIKNEVEQPIEAELDLAQPSLAATQFANQIGQAANASAEFGEAGFQAALAYQTGLEQIAQLQADGTLTSDEAKRAAEQEKAAFEAKIDVLERERQEQKKAADAAKSAADEKIAAAQRAADALIEADRRRADSFVSSQGIGAEDARTTAAENLLAITRQIDEAETAIVQARAAGDAATEQSALRRLAILDQAQAAAQEAIEFGFTTQQADAAIRDVREQLEDVFTFDNITLAPEAFEEAQRQLQQLEEALAGKFIEPEQFREAADQIRKGFEDGLATASKINDLQLQYAERAAEIDAERADALSRVSQEPLRVEDVRTSGGFAELVRLASGREDPAVEEARKQTQQLNKIAAEIRKLGGAVEMI